MINKVVLVGRLTKDIELKKTNSGLSVCRFTVACNRRFQSKQEGAPDADFIQCVAWRQSADFLSKYAAKGSIVGVEGRITTSSFEGQNGKVYRTEVTCDNVQLIGSKSSAAKTEVDTNKTFTPSSEPSFSGSENSVDEFQDTPSYDISDDDLPFY